MLYFDVPHGSDAWFECRRGIPTASCFSKIVTPLGKFSAQGKGYAHTMIAEILTGEVQEKFAPTYAMERGAIMEQEASEAYEFLTGNKLLPGCFIADDQMRWGASPDRLVADNDGNVIGCLEIKCPLGPTHVENLLEGTIDKAYIPQVQGQMMMDEKFQFAHWFSYHPQIIPSLITVQRNDGFIATLRHGLEEFHAYKMECLQRLVDMGALSSIPDKLVELQAKIKAPEDDNFTDYRMAG